MPKPITSEMLHAMTLAERKLLHQNALGRDTPAAHAVLDLLSCSRSVASGTLPLHRCPAMRIY